MATKFSFNVHNFAEANSKLAEAEALADWAIMTALEQDTWLTNSQFNSGSVVKDTDGRLAFMHYLMLLFGTGTNQNASAFATTVATNATSNNYVDRASWGWATT